MSDRPPFRLRVRGVDPGEVTTAFGAVRTGSVAIGHLVDVVFGRQRSTVPVLGLVTAQGGAQEVGVGDGVVHVVLPALDRTQVGPGATLATPGTVRAAAAAELVVQVLGELPLRVEVSAWELGRRLAGREGAAAVAGVVDAALAAERARPDPDPDRFWDRVLRELAERAPALEDEVRAARFDVNALASAVYLRPLGGRSVYLDFDGTVVHGRASDRLRAPDHPGAVLRAAVTLTPPIALDDEPLPVLGASGAGWADFRVGYAHVRGRLELDPEAPAAGCPLVPLADRAAFLAECGLSAGFAEVFARGSFLSFDAGDLEAVEHDDVDWAQWPELGARRWCPLTWRAGGAANWLVRPGPRFATFDEVAGFCEQPVDEEQVFREVVVDGVLREVEATGWFEQQPEELGELTREDLVTADGSEPPTPIRTRRLHFAERVQDAIRRLDLPYGHRLLDAALAD